MRASVVICTVGRSSELRRSLAALRLQRHRDFEVIVVEGPGERNELPLDVRREHTPKASAGAARNVGSAAAAGDVVVFIDDDAVAEPTWLSDLLAPYADPAVAGTGGLVLDRSGWRVQYRAAVCDRRGHTSFDRRPPLDEQARPGADPFLYLQGTNMSVRRDALVDVGGLEEEHTNVFDDVELSLALIDAGHRLVALDGAPVHHHHAPSAVRDASRALRDPLPLVRSRAHFALCHRGRRPVDEVLAAVSDDVEGLRLAIRTAADESAIDTIRRDELLRRIDRGLVEARALGGRRTVVGLPEAPAGAFRPYPDPGRRAGRRVVVVGDEERARELALRGEETHLIEHGGELPEVRLDDGLWRHLLGRRAGGAPGELAAAYHEVARVDRIDPVAEVFAADHPAGSPAGAWLASTKRRLPPEALEPSAFPLDFPTEIRRVWDAPPARFLSSVYTLALGRPSDALGRARWLPALHADGARLAVVQAVLGSEEARARDVPSRWAERLTEEFAAESVGRMVDAWLADEPTFLSVAYEAILQRRLDSDSRTRWLEHFAAGGSRFDTTDELPGSAEGRSRGAHPDLSEAVAAALRDALPAWLAAAPDDERFVRTLELGLLGRQLGTAHGTLDPDARLALVRTVAESAEAERRGMTADRARRLVGECEREWSAARTLALARSAATSLVAAWPSADDAGFVTEVYEAVLGRGPDPEGLAGWLGHLAGGGSRFDVVDNLAASPEAGERGLAATLGAEVRRAVFAALPGWLAAAGGDDHAFGRALRLGALGRANGGREARGRSERLDLVREIAGSDEARARGLNSRVLAGVIRGLEEGSQAEEPGEPGSPLPESAAGGAGDMAPNPDRSASP